MDQSQSSPIQTTQSPNKQLKSSSQQQSSSSSKIDTIQSDNVNKSTTTNSNQNVSQSIDSFNTNLSYAKTLTTLTNNEFNIPHVSQLNPSNPTTSNTFYKKPDYSEDNIKTPKKNQGIIIEAAQDFKIKQYLEAVGGIIGAQNIMYASRLSKERICMYLTSEKCVTDITEKFDYITIDETDLQIRPLLMRSTKFYLNRVCPSIPSSFLHDLISSMGINITSKIQREKMSYGEDEFSHVYSFRRTFYGFSEKNITIPESILIKYEQENHRIFMSTEVKRCSNCHKIGHIDEVCRQKEKITDNETEIIEHSNTLISQNLNSIDIDLRLSSSSLNTNITDADMIDISNMRDDNTIELSEDENNEEIIKKPTISNMQNLRAMEELEKVYKKYIHSDIDFKIFANFLTQISRKKINYEDMRNKYAKRIREMCEIIEMLRGVTQSGTKARLTRSLYKVKKIFKYVHQTSQNDK